MPDEKRAEPDLSLPHVAFGACAIAAMIAISLLAAWRLLVGFGGTLHDPPIRATPFPQPALQARPLADRREYEANEAQKRERVPTDAAVQSGRVP